MAYQLRQTLGEEAAGRPGLDGREKDAQRAEWRDAMRADFAELRQEMALMEARFERRFSDLIKRSFVFWVGAVGAIAMLAGVLH